MSVDTGTWATNPLDFEITLERTGCLGCRRCLGTPEYQVTLRGDGTVFYDGRKFVRVHGPVTDHVSPEDVRALAREFDRLGFDQLSAPGTCPDGLGKRGADATGMITGEATNRLTLSRRSGKRTVEDYVGNVCAPRELSRLVEGVDLIAHTDKWVGCKDGAWCSDVIVEREHVR